MSALTEAVGTGRSLIGTRRTPAGGHALAQADAPKPAWRLAVRAFSRDKMAVLSLVVLVVVALAAIFAPLLTSYSPVAGDR